MHAGLMRLLLALCTAHTLHTRCTHVAHTLHNSHKCFKRLMQAFPVHNGCLSKDQMESTLSIAGVVNHMPRGLKVLRKPACTSASKGRKIKISENSLRSNIPEDQNTTCTPNKLSFVLNGSVVNYASTSTYADCTLHFTSRRISASQDDLNQVPSVVHYYGNIYIYVYYCYHDYQ